MDKEEALRTLAEVVARLGDERARAALRSVEAELAGASPRAFSIAEVTQALLRSEETFRLVFSHERDPSSLFDVETGRFLEVNDAWVALYGYSREEALGMRVTDVSAEPATTRSAIARADREGVARIRVRWHKKKDGTVFPVELTAGPLELGGRHVMYAAMRDIGERLRAEEALARSEASFRALIESMEDCVVVHRRGEIVYMNPSARAALGYGPDDEVVGRPVLDLLHPDDRAMVRERVQKLLSDGTHLPLVEERLVRKDGRVIVQEVSAMPTEFGGEPAVIAIGRDVSARKRLEAQLMMADRLASIGRLAASVGHEINNPLAYVLGNISLMARDLEEARLPPELAERLGQRLDVMREGSERMRDIVRDLKTLSRADDEVRGPVDIARVLDTCADMAAHEIQHRARLVKDYRPGLYALASEARLGQVFLNLLVNAGQAIPEGAASTNEVRVIARSAGGGRIEVEIRDTGAGIRPEDREHIFEPFFTTKAPGTSSGLGLSICHHIVTSLGGTIEAVSLEPKRDPHSRSLEPKRDPHSRPLERGGTAFRVVLPEADAPPPARSRTPAPVEPAGVRVLVVDDEPALARVCAAQLDGYEAVVAYSGREAMERLAGQRFDAILCDLHMYDPTGVELYEWLREREPGAERRVVFMTGGVCTRAAQELLERIDNVCLEKPFSTEALREAVRRVIAAGAPAR